MRNLILIFLISQYLASAQTNLQFTFSQSSVEDWKQGRKQSFELNSGIDTRQEYSLDSIGLKFDYNLRLKLGLIMENGDKVLDDFIKPSVNMASTDLTMRYLVGWTLDPFVSAAANTQITESFVVVRDAPMRTANFWDPIITPQSLGFAYTYRKDRNNITSKIGLSIKQIRAKCHTGMTDDRATKDIVEGYKTEAGLSFTTDARVQIDSSINYTGRLDLFGKYENPEVWTVKFENQFDFKIWKFLGIVFECNICYDEKQMLKLQYIQNTRLGILTRF
jgi:hypothetical protein